MEKGKCKIRIDPALKNHLFDVQTGRWQRIALLASSLELVSWLGQKLDGQLGNPTRALGPRECLAGVQLGIPVNAAATISRKC